MHIDIVQKYPPTFLSRVTLTKIGLDIDKVSSAAKSLSLSETLVKTQELLQRFKGAQNKGFWHKYTAGTPLIALKTENVSKSPLKSDLVLRTWKVSWWWMWEVFTLYLSGWRHLTFPGLLINLLLSWHSQYEYHNIW